MKNIIIAGVIAGLLCAWSVPPARAQDTNYYGPNGQYLGHSSTFQRLPPVGEGIERNEGPGSLGWEERQRERMQDRVEQERNSYNARQRPLEDKFPHFNIGGED